MIQVQYLTASKYTRDYSPAIMADTDSRAYGVSKNSVWTGTVTRKNVAVANVGLVKGKKGKKGKTVPTAFPSCFKSGRAPAKFKYRLSKKTTRILEDNSEAEYDDHS